MARSDVQRLNPAISPKAYNAPEKHQTECNSKSRQGRCRCCFVKITLHALVTVVVGIGNYDAHRGRHVYFQHANGFLHFGIYLHHGGIIGFYFFVKIRF